LALIAGSRYTIGAVLEQQSAPAGPAITFADSEPRDGADHLALIAERIAALGPDHEFTVGLNALVTGLSALAVAELAP
jgi:TetR/AcrR family tetracycline transcriptional repressor